MNITTWELSDTAFDQIVIDTQNGLLGFDVNDMYSLPNNDDPVYPWERKDFNRDCSVDIRDFQILTEEWLNDCSALNWECRGADLNADNIVNFADYAEFLQNQ